MSSASALRPEVGHETEIIVRFGDLDPYNHVNHARYLTFFESARIEALDEMGFGMNAMAAAGYQIVLVDLHAEFHVPAGLHDRLRIDTEVIEVKRATSRWRQTAWRGDEKVVSLEVKAAFVGMEGRPVRAPDGFEAAAARFG
ncbi:MAG: acyl-CoA thioesterase [Acidimicrobiia bacterium]|nr:acyl-CoA thioesterase [Acidimicrobiia bacterium]MDH4309103.1 acyl-CoA thioesterase [Acidimicrobiia bacterium]